MSTYRKSSTRSRSLRVCLGALAGIALVGCGSGSGTSGPPVLAIFGDVTQSQGAPPALMSDRTSMLVNLKFDVAADLEALDGSAPAYVVGSGDLPVDDIATIQDVFGIEGTLNELPAESGGGFQVGSADGTGPALYVGADALRSWNYSPSWSESSIDPTCFDASQVHVDAPPTPVTDSVPAGEPLPGDDVLPAAPDGVSGSGEPCVDSSTPQNVPSKDEAVGLYVDLVTRLGVDADSLDIESWADDYGVSVTGYLRLAGIRSPLAWIVVFGSDSNIVFASGVIADPLSLADYPRIGTTEAVDRLNEQQSQMWRAATGTSTEENSEDSMSDNVTTVRITSVEEELVMLNGVDGSMYLVPGYAFLGELDEYGFEPRYTVSAIPDEFVDVTETEVGVDETEGQGSVDDGADQTEITADEANTLLGMSEAEATSAAEANGWKVRIAARDGEQFALTMDYSPRRVNLTIEAGIVTYLFIG